MSGTAASIHVKRHLHARVLQGAERDRVRGADWRAHAADVRGDRDRQGDARARLALGQGP